MSGCCAQFDTDLGFSEARQGWHGSRPPGLQHDMKAPDQQFISSLQRLLMLSLFNENYDHNEQYDYEERR